MQKQTALSTLAKDGPGIKGHASIAFESEEARKEARSDNANVGLFSGESAVKIALVVQKDWEARSPENSSQILPGNSNSHFKDGLVP